MKTDKPPIRIFIADNHQIFFDGIKELIKKTPEFYLSGETMEAGELITHSKNLKPDIIIVDAEMGCSNMTDIILQMLKASVSSGIIALSMKDEEDILIELVNAGVRGYLLKAVSPQEIVSAIKTVSAGHSYYCSKTTQRVSEFLTRNKCENLQQAKQHPKFSEREIMIMKLICQGYSCKQVANNLFLSKRTIEWHKEQILQKLGRSSSAEMIVYAVQNKIFP